MGNNLISKIVKISNLNIVSLTLDQGKETFRVVTAKKNAGKLTVSKATEYGDFESFTKGVNIKLPIILLMDGDGILSKKINFNDPSDLAWYKNIDFNTIFYTRLKAANFDFISFCRKTIVETSISRFKEAGFQVIEVYLGGFLSALVKPSINEPTILSGNIVLHFDGNSLVDFNKTQLGQTAEYLIGNDTVSSDMLPSYGVMLHFFLQNKEVEKTGDLAIDSEELLYKKAFQIFGAAMLILFFISLLASYLLTGYFTSENAQLSLKKVYSGETYNKILDLEAQKQDKLKILQESGLLADKFLSNYSYELAKMAPVQLTLTQLNIYPVKSEVKPEKKVMLESGIIVVKGLCNDESSLNSWLLELRKTAWVNNFEIGSVKMDKKGNTVFEIKITVKKNV